MLYVCYGVSSSAAELGIVGHEVREIFLAKVYELSKPTSNVGRMEDDFLCEFTKSRFIAE